MLKINYFLLITTKKSTFLLPKKLFSFSSLRLWRIEEDDGGDKRGIPGLKSYQMLQEKVNES
ncbi:hypothetical protein SAMD00079811_29940 [Scytonema sp. HK-05]|nr:hypothetical protein NIES2130_10475 [Scytonema sp. HK-05]BAY45391.1 hypothetical protein SAMD00079811_29940 [Scytonema sp. HK-05]